jgi:hypothetical protein
MTKIPEPVYERNIEVLGYHDLGGRPAFKLAVQEVGGRFGPHNHHHPNHQPCLEQRDDIAYLTYFSAGLRVYDIRDPRTPKEIACFIPPDPKERIGAKPSRLVAQVEDVLVDRRGCIYISEKNQGIYILRLKEVWRYAVTSSLA